MRAHSICLVLLGLSLAGALGVRAGRGSEPEGDGEALGALLQQVEAQEAAGFYDKAMVRALAVLAIEPGHTGAIDALARIAPRLAIGDRHPPARRADNELKGMTRDVDAISDRVKRLERAQNDDGRAEPLTRRLELELDEAKRTMRRTTDDLSRLRSDIDRLRREVQRLESRIR